MRTKRGTVTAAKMQGTVTVTVHHHVMHPLYKKNYLRSKKFLADSSGFDLGIGDLVEMSECRPISKRKHFRITQIVKAAPRLSEMVEEGGLEEVLEKKPKKPTEPKSSSSSVSSVASVPPSS